MSKSRLRKQMDEQRHSLEPTWIGKTSRRITDALQGLEPFQAANSIALYKAISGEVDLERLFPVCWQTRKRTCIPVFNRQLHCYEMAGIDRSTPFKTGNYGIQEPVSPALVPIETIDLIVVPGVAFDLSGNRLGRGGGYYDRLLDGYSGITVAVAFDFQVFPEIPCDAHDIPVDYLVTETKILKV